MDKTSIGDRMKFYEGMETDRKLMPHLPVLARMDGKCFSAFSRNLKKPFDLRLIGLMRKTLLYLMENTGACFGHTQSDEISLVWLQGELNSHMFMGGRIQKMVSILSAMTTCYFNKMLPETIPEKRDMFPIFDSRVWAVPSTVEAANVIVWRYQDAVRNSISISARNFFSHKQLYKKNSSEMISMLQKENVQWEDYPSPFKNGTFMQKRKIMLPFTSEEKEKLPPKHEAHFNSDLKVERTQIRELHMDGFFHIQNKVDVVFHGCDPIPVSII